MNRIEWKLLTLCAALACGETVGCCFSCAAELWPIILGAALLVVLLGYGFAWRLWPVLVAALLGLALFFVSVLETERSYRESPWLRTVARREVLRGEPTPFKRDLARRVGLGLEHAPVARALNRAILLGERGRIPAALKTTFRDAGTIHVFAISGLHVMIVARVLMFLVAFFLFVPYRAQGLVALPLLWSYVLLIGHPPSAVRAALMATFYFLAPVFWRKPNMMSSWAITFLIVHLAAPRQIADVGSLFSFTVMLALAIAGRIAKSMRESFRKTLFFAFAAWAAGVPIAASVFGRITPGGLLANLVLVVAAGYSVVAGAIGVLLSYLWEGLAVPCNNLSALMTQLMVLVSDLVSRLPGANLEISRWRWGCCVLWYVALGLFFYLVRIINMRRNRNFGNI